MIAALAMAAAVQQFTLDNGLRVVMQKDDSAPVTAVAMISGAGSRDEVPGRSGFSHLFEHLMFGGSRSVPKGGFDRILETYGGDNNASAHDSFTFYYEVVPSNALPIALWLDADRLGWLDVSKQAVATQIEVVKEEKRMRVDDEPYGPLLYVEMASHSFTNWRNAHPTIGSFEDLDAAKLKDVRAFFERHYAPSNVVLGIVGDIDYSETRALVERYFGPIKNRAKGRLPPPDLSEPVPTAEKTVRLKDEHAQLPALAVAWRGMPQRRTPDYYALAVASRLLFEGKSSRLYQSLIKRTKLAVSVDGGLGFPMSDAAGFAAPGIFGGFFVYKPGVAPSTLKAVIETEVGRLAREGVPAGELERAKTIMRGRRLRVLETRLGRVRELLQAALLDGDPAKADDLAAYEAVTSEDVKRAAGYLNAQAAVWFEVAPK